jgi:glyceraldehyde 3-phosphate dehydrogenase
MEKIKLGIMGFGEMGRTLYRQCLDDDRIEVVAISDIGRPEILHYLLQSHSKTELGVSLEGKHFVSKNGRARVINAITPSNVPWDALGADVVVDATGKYRSRKELEAHLESGAKRVILGFLPVDEIDRIVVMGVNEHTIRATDKLISPGSATTNATAIMLKLLDEAFGVDYATFTAIHEYTADQPLRDTAGSNFRRSRSAAQNIIPNVSPTPQWLPSVLPDFKGRVEGIALNVPVPAGTLLDLNSFLTREGVSLDEIHAAMKAAEVRFPHIFKYEEEPIVSSDVIGDTHSVIYDKEATMQSKGSMLKTMVWYHVAASLSARIKELILAYHEIDTKGGVK